MYYHCEVNQFTVILAAQYLFVKILFFSAAHSGLDNNIPAMLAS